MLKTSKIILFIGLGIIFWFAAAMFVRLADSAVFTPANPLLIVLYVVSIPVTLALNWIASVVSRVPMQDMFEPAVIMTIIATLLDGVAITWVTQLYGDNPSQVMLGAAWILYGAGLGLLWAWVFAKMRRSAAA